MSTRNFHRFSLDTKFYGVQHANFLILLNVGCGVGVEEKATKLTSFCVKLSKNICRRLNSTKLVEAVHYRSEKATHFSNFYIAVLLCLP